MPRRVGVVRVLYIGTINSVPYDKRSTNLMTKIRAILTSVRHQEVVIEMPFRSALWDKLSTKPNTLTALSVGKLDFF